MRVRNLGVAALAIVCTIGAASARATFVTYDDFSTAGAPDSSKWGVFSSGAVAPTVSGGDLQMNGAAAPTAWQGIYSTQNFSYGSFRFNLDSYNNANACMFAVNSQTTDSPASLDEISLRNDGGALIAKGGSTKVSMIDYATSSLPAAYTFVWHPDLVQVLRDTGSGNTVLYSTTDTSLIPTGALRFELVAYGSGAYAVNSVGYEAYATPEPSTMMLVATGMLSLLAYAWRKRR
jgi:hypothetical protein